MLEMELFLFCQTLCEEGLLECRLTAKPREVGLFDDVFEVTEQPFSEETLLDSYCYGLDAETEYSFFPRPQLSMRLLRCFNDLFLEQV